MDYYPSNLKYILNTLSGFSRMRNKLTLPFTLARGGDLIFFKLPTNCLLDLDSLCFHFDVATDGASGSTSYTYIPQYTGCLIDMLSVDINGVNIQTIPQYGQLFKMLSNYTSGDKSNLGGFLEWCGQTNQVPLGTAKNTMGTTYSETSPSGLSLAIKNWLGFLGSKKIINTAILGEITVSMRLVPNSALISANGSPKYILNNMSVQFDTINLDNPVYHQSIYRQLENGGLKMGFTNYITNIGGVSALPVSQTFSVSTQSLDYLLGTLLQNNYNTEGTSAGNQYIQAAGTSRYFTHGNDATNFGLTTSQFQIGTVQIPNYRGNMAEILSYTIDSLGLSSDIVGCSAHTLKPIIGMNPQLPTGTRKNDDNYANFFNGNFLLAARLCHGDKDPNGVLLSGLNTAGTNTTINFRVEGTGSGQYIPLTFAVCTSVLTIGTGRQINLTL